MNGFGTCSAWRRAALAGIWCVVAAAAQAAAAPDDAQARYQREVAACNAGRTGEDKATCLKEAGAVLEEARRAGRTGAASDDKPPAYKQNALARCAALPAADREDCRARIERPTTVEGSVAGGGVLRETVQTVPAASAPAPASGASR